MKEKNIKVAFFDTKNYDRLSFDAGLPPEGVEIKYFEPKLSRDTLALANGFDAVCAFVNDDLSKDVLDGLVSFGIALVVMRCAGYNNVDLAAAYGRIHVLRVPAYSPHAVAEHALAMMLTLNRKTHKAYYRTRENNFSIDGLTGFDLHGKTAGVLGTGRIGLVMIGILKGLGMNVLAYDPFPRPDLAAEMGFTCAGLDELYGKADIISLHCPLTPETRHIIDRTAIGRMKDGVMIINTGRGGLIDAAALVEGLKSKKIGCAGLDVYEEEGDYFFKDLSAEGIRDDVLARLLSFPNVLVTSHQAFLTREALANIAETTFAIIRAFAAGGTLPNEICYRCDRKNCAKELTGRCF
jgi:D-lactate dehydrogenase